MSIKKEFTFKGYYIVDNAKSNYKQIMEEYLLEYLKQICLNDHESSNDKNKNTN